MICHLFVDSTNIVLFPSKGYSRRRQKALKRSQSGDANSRTSHTILLLIPSGPVALPGNSGYVAQTNNNVIRSTHI